MLRHPTNHTKCRVLSQADISDVELLLVDVLDEGKSVYEVPSIEQMRVSREKDIEQLDSGVRRIMYPHIYHVSLTQKLWDLKQDLIKSAIQ